MTDAVGLSDFAPVVRTFIEQHTAWCALCRWRWDRTLQLARQRMEGLRDETEPDTGHAVTYAGMLSPLGTLWIASTGGRICRASFDENELRFCDAVERAGYGIPHLDPAAMQPITERLAAYFSGRGRHLDLPVDLGKRTTFQRAVLQAVHRIPYGQTRSYGEIAAEVGRPAAIRAVGTVMANNSLTLVIPCHRVVRGDRSAGSYATESLGDCGPLYKGMLLSLEQPP